MNKCLSAIFNWAKYHLKVDNKHMTLELFQNIASMEDEHEAQALTDHNKKTIN